MPPGHDGRELEALAHTGTGARARMRIRAGMPEEIRLGRLRHRVADNVPVHADAREHAVAGGGARVLVDARVVGIDIISVIVGIVGIVVDRD